MHLLSLLFSLLVSMLLPDSDSQAINSTFNFTTQPNISSVNHKSDLSVADNWKADEDNSYRSSSLNYTFNSPEIQGSGKADFEKDSRALDCKNCFTSESGTVNVQEENNTGSEISSYPGTSFTPVECGDCGLPGDFVDEVTTASVYEKNGCAQSGGELQWECLYWDGRGPGCINISVCEIAALPGRQVCDRWGQECVYVDEVDFSALYYRCIFGINGRMDECFLVTVLQQGDRYTLCEYREGINTHPLSCDDYSAIKYCRYTQPTMSAKCVNEAMADKNSCGHSGGLVQWECSYTTDTNKFTFCYSLIKCKTAALPERRVCDQWGQGCVFVDGANFTSLYYKCLYDMDRCYLVTTSQQGDRYRMCQYHYGINREPSCYDYTASAYCTETQPSTNRLTHTTIPPTMYILGLLLNHLILLVLAWKAEDTVTNCLLKLLAVWDSLFLVCQLGEWVVWMQTVHVRSVIKDVGYAWVDTGCFLEARGYIQGEEFCHMTKRWRGADINVAVDDASMSWNVVQFMTMYYVIMYWLHTAARLFQFMSVYQTVIIACFRYIAIQFPFEADRYLTYTTAWLATLGCFVLALLLHIPSVIGGAAIYTATGCWHKGYVTFEYTDDQYDQCNSDLANKNPFYSTLDISFVTFFHVYHVIFYHIVMFFALPFVILLVLNTLMLRDLWRGSQTQENIAVTRVVVAIISVFLISYCVKPFYIIDIFYFNGSLMDSIAYSSCSTYFTMSVLIIILPCFNSSVNFIIYVGFRESFRRQFVSMFDWCSMRCPSHCNK